MELLSSIITVLLLLFACQHHNTMGYSCERITYSSDILRDIGGHIGAKPRIANSLFVDLHEFGISRIRR